MDAGHFERSRLRFWLWIGTPLVLVLLSGIPSWLYLRHARRVLAARQAVLATVMPMEETLANVDTLLKQTVADARHRAEAVDDTTHRLTQAAQKSGLTIQSMEVDKNTGDSDGLKTIRIIVQGQGRLPAVVRWLAEVQKPGLLVRVNEAKVTALSLPPEDVVSAEFVILLFLRSA